MKLTKINLLIITPDNGIRKKPRWFAFFSKNIQPEKSLHVNINYINKQQ